MSLQLGVEPGPPGWLLPGVKSTSYAVNMAGEAEARRRGADDAVFLANGDIVLEAPISNIWWRRGDELFTPSLEVGVLAGVTRATLLELAPAAGYRVEQGAYARAALAGAEEAFTSSSIREVLPVVELDGQAHRRRRPGTRRAGAPGGAPQPRHLFRVGECPPKRGSLNPWQRKRSGSVAWLS